MDAFQSELVSHLVFSLIVRYAALQETLVATFQPCGGRVVCISPISFSTLYKHQINQITAPSAIIIINNNSKKEKITHTNTHTKKKKNLVIKGRNSLLIDDCWGCDRIN